MKAGRRMNWVFVRSCADSVIIDSLVYTTTKYNSKSFSTNDFVTAMNPSSTTLDTSLVVWEMGMSWLNTQVKWRQREGTKWDLFRSCPGRVINCLIFDTTTKENTNSYVRTVWRRWIYYNTNKVLLTSPERPAGTLQRVCIARKYTSRTIHNFGLEIGGADVAGFHTAVGGYLLTLLQCVPLVLYGRNTLSQVSTRPMRVLLEVPSLGGVCRESSNFIIVHGPGAIVVSLLSKGWMVAFGANLSRIIAGYGVRQVLRGTKGNRTDGTHKKL